jgi:ornithine decarboxylase
MSNARRGPALAPVPSILPDAHGASWLPVFGSVEEALSAHDGDDPLFVLYPQRISAAADVFLKGFSGRTMFAVKVNPHPAVLRTLWAAGVRDFDVASAREIALVKRVLPASARMAFMHPVKPRGAIRAAYEAGVRAFAFDTAEELRKIIGETGGAADLTLYLRLALAKGGSAMMDLSGKFGATLDDAAELLRAARPMARKLGLTFHVGSQCMAPQAYADAIAHARTAADAAGVGIDALDVGGGFPARYPGMEPVAMQAYFDAIAEAVKANGFGRARLLAEPGRALVADGGATLARIELRRGRDLFLNDGSYGSMYDAANFAWRYPTRLIRARGREVPDEELADYRFFGPTCDSADRMEGPFVLPADATEGDWIEIGGLGAYGQTMATRFNGYYSDATVAVLDGARLAAFG